MGKARIRKDAGFFVAPSLQAMAACGQPCCHGAFAPTTGRIAFLILLLVFVYSVFIGDICDYLSQYHLKTQNTADWSCIFDSKKY
ncbi:hypothetical protein ABIC71_004248 [Herbaspirillum seropedicae]|uniref:hypothetical protein n=1 Tax=Herbaspirillum seropedicae TaxID=964 RepID=UPI00339AA1FD